MQRLLFERFAEQENAEVYNPMGPLNLVQICNRENLDLALSDPNTLTILERYTSYRRLSAQRSIWKDSQILAKRDTSHTYVAVFVEDQQLPLFHKCNGDMADLFSLMTGQTAQGNLLVNMKLHKSH